MAKYAMYEYPCGQWFEKRPDEPSDFLTAHVALCRECRGELG